MSRRLACRWELTGVLVALSPVHVGNIDDDIGVELSQARDGLNRPVLPGTTLAGVIRSALPDTWGKDPLWGCVSGRTDKGGDDGTGRASWVWVDDATGPVDTVPEHRDTASIDRMTGGPARGHLFTREVVPAGTQFTFRLAVDDAEPGPNSRAHRLVDRIADLLRGPGIAIGGATSRGLGRVHLADARLRRMDLATRAGILAALRGEPASEQPRSGVDSAAVPPGIVRIRIPWRPAGPVMVGVAADGGTIDLLPLTTTVDGHSRLVIPGSSIKGVLRSHAERITRTVLGADVPTTFLDQMRGLAVVERLFGTAAERVNGSNKGQRGSVTVHECRSTVPLPADLWEAVLTPEPPGGNGDAEDDSNRLARTRTQQRIEKLNDELKQQGHGLWFTANTRVAVDRWTGGVAEGRLFVVLEPRATGNLWEPIVIDVAVGRLRELADQALVLVLLVLRDLCDGWIGFGRGTTRGMGSVRISAGDITFSAYPGVSSIWSEVDGKTFGSLLRDVDLTEVLLAAWPPERDEAEEVTR